MDVLRLTGRRPLPIIIESVSRMNPQRLWGFRDFVRMRGYSSLYLFSVGSTRPIKVGITDDPLRRLGDFQVAHYHTGESHLAPRAEPPPLRRGLSG